MTWRCKRAPPFFGRSKRREVNLVAHADYARANRTGRDRCGAGIGGKALMEAGRDAATRKQLARPAVWQSTSTRPGKFTHGTDMIPEGMLLGV